jgi:hypothetical protein
VYWEGADLKAIVNFMTAFFTLRDSAYSKLRVVTLSQV